MPAGAVREALWSALRPRDTVPPYPDDSVRVWRVVRLMQRRFQVSATAAEMRLRRLPYLIDARPHAECRPFVAHACA
jgi:hypothetical protein